MDSLVTLENLKIVGTADCVGGLHPEPPIHDYSLLVYAPAQYGVGVWTEDGKASVDQISAAIVELLTMEAVAARFGTTVDHVAQAVDYALKAGYLGGIG